MRYVRKPSCELEMGLEFCERPARYGEVMRVVTTVRSAVTLGDVCRDGAGTSSNLSDEAEALIAWKQPRYVIALHGEFHGPLPNVQLLEALNSLAHRNKTVRRQVSHFASEDSSSPSSERHG